MTITQALQTIRQMGLSARYRDNEFRVTIKGFTPKIQEAIAYYTNDAQDAIDTAKCIAKENNIVVK